MENEDGMMKQNWEIRVLGLIVDFGHLCWPKSQQLNKSQAKSKLGVLMYFCMNIEMDIWSVIGWFVMKWLFWNEYVTYASSKMLFLPNFELWNV